MAASVPVESVSGKYYPLLSQNITQGYRVANNRYQTGYHTGIDYAAGIGAPVFAAQGGTVTEVKNTGGIGYGRQILIQDTDGIYELYGHLSNTGSLKPGNIVETGTQIAQSGNSGNSTGPHLHFEVRANKNYGSDIDPLGWLNMPTRATTAGGTVVPTGFNNPNIKPADIQAPGKNSGQSNPLFTNPFNGISGFINIISDGQFWIRVLEIALGILLAMFGLAIFTKGSFIPGAGQTLAAVKSLKK